MRTTLMLLLALLLPTVAPAAGLRYMPPPRGRLVFEQVLAAHQSLPLRLPKLGRYYLELLREIPAGGDERAVAAPLDAVLELRFARGAHELATRTLEVHFAPGERGRTLAWLDAPDTLPERTTLAFDITLRGPTAADLAATPLRLTLTRKLELAPVIVR